MFQFKIWILATGFVLTLGQDAEDWKAQKLAKLEQVPTSDPSEAIINYFGIGKKNLMHFRNAFRNILIPRPPGSKGIKKVKNFIVKNLESLGWEVEIDSFEDPKTAIGKMFFENIVATLNPEAPRRLTIACHYDSKISPKGFLGATDSAVPCAQMLNLAHTLKAELNNHKETVKDVTLQFIFFDGEEAFIQWTDEDSLYGSRHLAQKWQMTEFIHEGVSGNFLDRIDMFMLIDLLGCKGVNLHSRYESTRKWFDRLTAIESSLVNSKVVNEEDERIFVGHMNYEIEDDHIPFVRRGVNVLHLIAFPFPTVWHTIKDNRKAVHMATVEKLNMIFRIFLAEYLGLTLKKDVEPKKFENKEFKHNKFG